MRDSNGKEMMQCKVIKDTVAAGGVLFTGYFCELVKTM